MTLPELDGDDVKSANERHEIFSADVQHPNDLSLGGTHQQQQRAGGHVVH